MIISDNGYDYAALEKYRLFKYLTFDEREASSTTSSSPRYHSPINQTGDLTGSIAIYNVDEQERRRQFCERLKEL